ncbi:MAG TPA: hypothetical protein PLC80_00205 [Draconibacterium sp.]|nr:hypothetical protein [Draconibacterium sp.]
MRILTMLILVMIFSSCVKNKNGQINQEQSTADGKSFEVTEVIQGSTYTYIRAKENNGELWMAISKQEVEPGEVYYYSEGLPMQNFHSKEIDRTFDEIYFVSAISKTPIKAGAMGGMGSGAMGGMGAMGGNMNEPAHSGKVSTEQNSAISVEKLAGEITVAQVFANRNNYSGKEIEIKGVVVKVNKEVMGKNWIHIQDGTNDNGNYDLTITSADLAEVNDEITVRGKIILNKDFGYGYSYEVIMEDAQIVEKKPAGSAI